jgi:heat shock protein HtpX
MQRILLFVLTNMAVMAVVGIITSLLGLGHYTGGSGSAAQLMVFALVAGFAGSIISLLMSKFSAKMSMGVQVITQPRNADETWLLETVRKFAQQAGIGMPEVGIYQGEPNAFATGAFRNSALVAVSTGLLQSMTREEVEAVLGHEMSHVANGDMVTMALIQGVMNTFVVFLSRIAGSLIDGYLRRDGESRGPGIGYYLATMVLQVVFGFLAAIVVAWFSRRREFRADHGAAQLMGSPRAMIAALSRLGGLHAEGQDMPRNLAAMGITGGIGQLFASHPPMEARIAALQAMQSR